MLEVQIVKYKDFFLFFDLYWMHFLNVVLPELISDANFIGDRAGLLCKSAIKGILLPRGSFDLEYVLELLTLALCYRCLFWISNRSACQKPFHRVQGHIKCNLAFNWRFRNKLAFDDLRYLVLFYNWTKLELNFSSNSLNCSSPPWNIAETFEQNVRLAVRSRLVWNNKCVSNTVSFRELVKFARWMRQRHFAIHLCRVLMAASRSESLNLVPIRTT